MNVRKFTAWIWTLLVALSALAIAIGYVLGRKRSGGADEIDVAISALVIADFCATLVLFYVAHATRIF